MVKLILATSTSSLSIYLEPNPSSLCPHPSDKKKFLSLSSMASMFPKLMVKSQSSPSQSLCSNHHNWSLHPQKADSASVTFFWLLPLFPFVRISLSHSFDFQMVTWPDESLSCDLSLSKFKSLPRLKRVSNIATLALLMISSHRKALLTTFLFLSPPLSFSLNIRLRFSNPNLSFTNFFFFKDVPFYIFSVSKMVASSTQLQLWNNTWAFHALRLHV